MKKPFLVIVFLVVLVNITFAIDDWDRAVENYKKNVHLQPHKVIFNSTISNKSDEIEKEIKQIANLEYTDEQQPKMIILQATENGKDVTEKTRKEFENPDNDNHGNIKEYEGISEHPLDYRLQKNITKTQREEHESKNGYYCSVWDFSFRLNDKYTGEGVAWIDVERGRPIYFIYSITPDSMFVKSFSIQLFFNLDGGKNWITRQIIMTGNFTFMFINKKFSTSSKMYNWTPEKLEKPFFSM